MKNILQTLLFVCLALYAGTIVFLCVGFVGFLVSVMRQPRPRR